MSRFLWLPLVIYLLTLISLGQFYRPQVDDLGWFYIVQKLGVEGGLQWLWQTNGGRLFSHLLILGAAKTGWPITLPWLLPAITITFQWIASLSLLRALRIYMPGAIFTRDIFFYSLVLTIAPFALVPEPATALFWYTGAALYQWPYIMSLLLFSCLLYWMKRRKNSWLFLTAILLFCTGNGNELSALFINGSFFILCFLLYKRENKRSNALIFLSLTAIGALLMNFSSPGLYERKEMMIQGKQLLSTPAAWLFWMIAGVWQLACIPLTWILAADFSAIKSPTLRTKRWWIFFALLAGILFFILYGTGGSLAFRTLNALVIFLLILVLTIAPGHNILGMAMGAVNRKWIYFFAILATPLTYQMIQTAIAGPVFAKAYDLQRSLILNANMAEPIVPPITYTMDSLAQKTSGRKLLQVTAAKKPSLIWFDQTGNEQSTLQYMLRLTGKESIMWEGKKLLNDHHSFIFPSK